MRHRLILVGLIVSLALIAAMGVYLSTQRREVPLPGSVTLVYPNLEHENMLWPLNQSWIWSMHGLDPKHPGKNVSLVARIVHQTLKPGENPQIGIRTISKAQSESELSLGKLPVENRDSVVRVSVQFIDASKVAAAGAKAPLRMLLTLKVGGMAASREGDQNLLEGVTFQGHALNPEAVWKEGELHLQTLYTQSGDRVTIYDVVVQSE